MKILIVGGNGFLGTNLVRYYSAHYTHEITVLDTVERASENNFPFLSDIRVIRGSLMNEELLESLIRDVHIVFNCAAQSSHVLSISNPVADAHVNALGHLRLLEAVRVHQPAAAVVYPSSTTVVGRRGEEVADESSQEIPQDIYSASKLAAENYSRIYHDVHGLKTVVLRLPNVFGPFGRELPEFGFINYFIRQARRGEVIKIFGDGEQTRNVMHVEDAVALLAAAPLNARLYGKPFFATTPYYHSVGEIAREILEVFQSGSISFEPWPHIRRRIDVGPQKFSSKRLAALSDWIPKISLREGLMATRDFMASHERREL